MKGMQGSPKMDLLKVKTSNGGYRDECPKEPLWKQFLFLSHEGETYRKMVQNYGTGSSRNVSGFTGE